MKHYIALLMATMALIACSTPNKPDTIKAEAAPQASSTTVAAETDNAATKQLAAETSAAQKLDKDSVYFDFDKSAVKSQFHALLKKQADFLIANKNVSVTLQGNCDERGSNEYNLGLGSRRASAVSSQLQALGVAKDRIQAVSNGEEKPRLSCHEEKCWKENRRVDFEHKVN